jgi:hypothetical protein
VRLYAREVGAELQKIFERKPEAASPSAPPVNDQYTESVEQEMDNLFKD